MITIENYFEKKKEINWEFVDQKVVDGIESAEGVLTLLNEYPEMMSDQQLRKPIDAFLKAVNEQFKTTSTTKKRTTRKRSTSAPKKQLGKQETPKPIQQKSKRLSTHAQIQQTKYFKRLAPYNQRQALIEMNSVELDDVIGRVEKELASIPKKPQGDSIKKSTVYAHYFHGETDWYITDIAEDRNSLFGYVILNGDTQMAEAGYISIDEITQERDHKFTVQYGVTELDFYFKKDILENILYKQYPSDYPNPTQRKQTSTASKTEAKPKPQKKTIQKTVDIKMVDHFSTEYRLIRRFYNLIRLNKTATFRKIQLVYMAFQKAALDRSIRKTSSDADLFTRIHKKVIALFDIVNPVKGDADIEFTDQKLYLEMEAYSKERKVNYAITLLKSFIGMQGFKPERTKATNLLKRINSAIEKEKVTKSNRLYKDVVNAKMALESYLATPSKKIAPKLVGLSIPVRSLCTNRIKCIGLRKDGKLNKGYRFLEGGSVIASKKKAV
ncbi:hypothetical protein H2O64_04710 [Kordia sp. YSTF-M3]|uniref:Uncharacterized protein n=1 Tax=Kordia aestuariivivens TaxID=2759037 RepID=A0ABR7Q5Z1_9FLAO|nr:hypothetical protein [Kordia aestuariivivens]MBC8753960.1 hypothetical protein [Kordia aestuariivivens]